MDTTATIIGIIGLVVGVSGWAAFIFQLQQNQNNKKRAIQDTLEGLDQLVGRWMDRIAGIVGNNDDYQDLATKYLYVAGKINVFNAEQGGYETEMRHSIYHLPEDHKFDDVRQGFRAFAIMAFDVKDGLIGDLADEAHPPLSEDEWETRKNNGISGLRAKCAELQELLQQLMQDT